MQKAPYPNRFRALVKEAGLNIREVHRETGIPESTLRWWASGNAVIPSRERVILARIIGCDIHDLAPFHQDELAPKVERELETALVGSGWNSPQTALEERVVIGKMYGQEMQYSHTSHNLDTLASQHAMHLMELANVDCFAVDDMLTLTQSHAFRGWNRDEIFLTKLVSPLPVPEDIEALRQEKLPLIQKHFINSSHYRLVSFTPAFSDRKGLEVTVAPLGFYDFYTLIPFLDEPLVVGKNGTKISIREKYGSMALTYASGNTNPVPAPIALHCVIVTKDSQIILMQRSNSVAFYPNHWSASFEETMDSPGISPKGNTRPGDADFFACAIRGIEEELGVIAEAIDTIKVLSLNVEYLILAVAVVAIIKTHLTAQEIKSLWLTQAPDRNEASKFAAISTDPSVVLQKLFSGDVLWHPTARMRLIQFLFHTYGVKEITALFKSRVL